MTRADEARAASARCLTRTIAEYAEAGHLLHVESERPGEGELAVRLRLSDPDRFHEMLSACLIAEGVGAEEAE